MEGLASVHDLQALSALLSPPHEDEEEEDIQQVKPIARMGPGHIGSPAAPSGKNNKEGSTAYLKKNSKDIWYEDEVTEGAHFDDLADPRPQPEYEIVLKQSVGTEDLFLGLSRKDPSSMCCDSILVRVKLPDTKASDLVLDVRETFLDLRTPKYKLGLHLPHPVHKLEGNARFIVEREELEITLPMNRPMDCINLT
ncbi:PIH1D3 [Labeo rohita]|uniref:PIH1D3 n=2 Tax=Labeo rohita TaxID=84645 RepID=A0A498M2N4_LABRO|nr:protein PIH1D3 [Labeo rohita]KAI2667845.1 Dynein axonemal assembly factor 6 [Labeo rohita]RXN12294.1 PIH1D3 [Labeo rohita]RXN15119.1 PIH1D3 [Labeo rohita]